MDFSKLKPRPHVGTYRVPAARIVDGVLVDPENPPGDCSHHLRAREELLIWWRLPYIVSQNGGYDVWVLYEGAHDRAVFRGHYDTVEEAAAAARAFHDDALTIGVMD